MILLINAAVCLAFAVRLFLFQRNKGNHKIVYAFIAWGLICSSASVTIFIVFNEPKHALNAQIVMNFLMFVCMLKTKGNVSDFIFKLCMQSKHNVARKSKKVKTS